jgi:hypothetical protein
MNQSLLFALLPILSSAAPVKNSQADLPASEPHAYLAPESTDPFYLTGEFLYWTVSRNFTEYGTEKSNQVNGANETAFVVGSTLGLQGKFHQNKYSWAPGARATIGYAFNETPWLVQAEYTFFETSRSHTIALVPGPFSYYTTLLTPYPSGTVTAIQWNNNFHFHLASLNLGFGFDPTKNIQMQLSTGPVASWLHDRFNANLVNSAIGPIGTGKKLTFRGAGMNVGAETLFSIWKGISFDMGGSWNFLYGINDFVTTAQIPENQLSSERNLVNAKQLSFYSAIQITQLYADLGWGYRWNDLSFSLKAGYEFNALTNFYSDVVNYKFATTNTNFHFDSQLNTTAYIHGITGSLGIAF